MHQERFSFSGDAKVHLACLGKTQEAHGESLVSDNQDEDRYLCVIQFLRVCVQNLVIQ